MAPDAVLIRTYVYFIANPWKPTLCIPQVDLGGLPAPITNHIMKQQPLSIRLISEQLDHLERQGGLNLHVQYGLLNNTTDERTTSELPTPGTTHQEVKFSSISAGSNPLYQQSWSMSTRTSGKHFTSKLGSGGCSEQQCHLDNGGTLSTSRKISTVLEEPELENRLVVEEQSTDQAKEQSLMFEVSMYSKKKWNNN